MMKGKKFTRSITADDLLDVTLHYEKKILHKFALNYRSKIKGKWKEVYRVDNFHGYLHEQKFWRSRKPIPIESEPLDLDQTVNKFIDRIFENFEKYRKYFNDSTKKRDEKDEKKNNKKGTRKKGTRS